MSDPRNGIMMKMFHFIDIGVRAGSGNHLTDDGLNRTPFEPVR